MSDSEFLAILNLYLDHEISAADSARLEAEVTSNSDRRRIYRQYCRMHKACILLGDRTAETSPAWETEKAAAFSAKPRAWTPAAYATTGLLAAACAAAVFALRWPAPAAAPAQAVAVATAAPSQPAAVVAASEVASVQPRPNRQELQPAFTMRALPSLVDTAAQAPSPELKDQFAWMTRMQLAPLQETPIEQAMFQPPPVLLDGDTAIHPSSFAPTTLERASFQFQR